MMAVAGLLMLLGLGCEAETERDEYGCWSDDRQIWIAFWDEWCATLDACGTLERFSGYPDLATCRSDARARASNSQARCLNGCAMDGCLEDIATYGEFCQDSDLVSVPPGFCDVVLSSSNPHVECEP